MLVATPYRDLDDPPRIISLVEKKCAHHNLIPSLMNYAFKPKLTGDLLVKVGNETKWWPRRVAIRNGQMHIFRCRTMIEDETVSTKSTNTMKLPLRHLSLRDGPLVNSIALYRGQNLIVTLQMPDEQIYDLWLKIIAIELIRQTPLEAVKYLDIFTLVNCWKKTGGVSGAAGSAEPPSIDIDSLNNEYSRDYNCNLIDQPAGLPLAKDEVDCSSSRRIPPHATINSPTNFAVTKNLPPLVSGTTPVLLDDAIDEEKTVEVLMKKCQNPENYVPVKEKLILFESLCKLGRKVRSTEDVSSSSSCYGSFYYNKMAATLAPSCVYNNAKRARSMHDLSTMATGGAMMGKQKAVREICDFFEEFKKTEFVHKYGTMLRRSDCRNNNNNNLLNDQRIH